jgi:hypothetical protein
MQGAPQNTKLPDLPKPDDWVKHLPGLIPFAIVLALVIFGFVTVPKWLRDRDRDDFRGVPVHTSAGTVEQLLDNPGHFGGAGVFNAVVIEVDGHKVYWDLPPHSQWKPMIGEIAEVRYRVGKSGSHVVHIDSVQWGTSMDPQYRKLQPNLIR